MVYKDLHNHTQWSDGNDSIAELVSRARKHNLQEIGISDHYEMITNKETYNKHITASRRVFPDIKIVAGVEIKIGTLLKIPATELDHLNQYE